MKAYNKLTEQDKNNILAEYYNGVDFKSIHQRLDVSERSVSRVLKEFGVNTARKNRYTLDEHYFDNIDTEVKAYILGFIYADGYVGDESTNNVVISVTREDRHLLHRIAAEMDFRNAPIRDAEKGGSFEGSKPKTVLNFSSEIMTKRLREIGLYPNKSMTISLLHDIPERLMRHFIRGYFDGDGCIGVYKNTRSYTTSDGVIKVYEYDKPSFSIIGTEQFLINLGEHIPVSCSIDNSKTPEMKYLCCSGKSNAQKLFKYLYNDCSICLYRKHTKWHGIIGVDEEQSSFVTG